MRFLEQPWWLRWLITWAFLGCSFVVVFGLQVSHPWERVAPPVLGLALAGLSFAAAGASTLLQSTARAAYTQALAGLSPTQQTAVSHALRSGDVPGDPRVLAAAVRCGAVIEGQYRRVGRGRFIAVLVCGVLLGVVAVVSFLVVDNGRHGILSLLMAALVTVPVVVRQRNGAAVDTRLAPLRAAADRSPEITAADITPPPTPKRKIGHIVVFVLTTGVIVAGFTSLTDQQRRDCRTVEAAAKYLDDHREMLDLEKTTAGGPDLRAYQGWADQLSRYASQVSAADIAPHLRVIADRARDMVGLVSQTRAAKPPRPVVDVQLEYGQQSLDILKEQRAVAAACQR